GNWKVGREFGRIPGTALHRLKEQPSTYQAGDLFEGVERVTQVIQHTHEDHVVELLTGDDLVDVVHITLGELDSQAEFFPREARLLQIDRIVVDAEHPRRPATFHLE